MLIESALRATLDTGLLPTLSLLSVTLVVTTLAVVAVGFLRDCTGQHAGAGPGATTVAHIQAALAAEARHRAEKRDPHHRTANAVTPCATEWPGQPEEYIGRHRLREPDDTVAHDLHTESGFVRVPSATDRW